MRSAVSGVSLRRLDRRSPLPAPSAGASLRVIIAAGKFHGVIIATTPTGGWWTMIRLAPDGASRELAADAHRLLGVPAEELGRVGDLALGVGERLAVLAHDQRGQLVGVVDQDLPAVAQHLAALARRRRAPTPAGPPRPRRRRRRRRSPCRRRPRPPARRSPGRAPRSGRPSNPAAIPRRSTVPYACRERTPTMVLAPRSPAPSSVLTALSCTPVGAARHRYSRGTVGRRRKKPAVLELDAIDKASIPLFVLTMLGEWWLLRDRPQRTLGDMYDATPEQLSGTQLPPDDARADRLRAARHGRQPDDAARQRGRQFRRSPARSPRPTSGCSSTASRTSARAAAPAHGDGAVGPPLLLGASLDARGARCSGRTTSPTTRASATTCRPRLRQPWSPFLVSWVFAPMPLLGYPTATTRRAGQLNLLYQYWIHTEAIDRLPALAEKVFNTPSHHRVPPRRQPAVPRQELRRHPDRVGQAVRHVRAGDAPHQVRPDEEHPHVQPDQGRLPRVRRHRPRRAPLRVGTRRLARRLRAARVGAAPPIPSSWPRRTSV